MPPGFMKYSWMVMVRRAERRSCQRRGKVPSPFSASSTHVPGRSAEPVSSPTLSGKVGSEGGSGAPSGPKPRTCFTAVPRVR